jgi:peptidoglycan L-alanyl-D-glutamate endopeptidase CwlK
MSQFGQKSLERLNECHPDLQTIMYELIKIMDVTITCGYRGEAEQNQAFKLGNSKVQYPNSMHNKSPSLAVDVCPYPIDYSDIKRFEIMCNYIVAIASVKGIKIRLGRDFTTLKDWPHVELI